jgi:hypothetical protein
MSLKKKKSPNISVTKNISIHRIGSPEQRSLARKMGSDYSPKTPPKTKRVNNVRIRIVRANYQCGFLHIANRLFRNVPNVDQLFGNDPNKNR